MEEKSRLSLMELLTALCGFRALIRENAHHATIKRRGLTNANEAARCNHGPLIVSIVPTILMGASTTGLAAQSDMHPYYIMVYRLQATPSLSIARAHSLVNVWFIASGTRKARNQCATLTCFFLLLLQQSPAIANTSIKLPCTDRCTWPLAKLAKSFNLYITN